VAEGKLLFEEPVRRSNTCRVPCNTSRRIRYPEKELQSAVIDCVSTDGGQTRERGRLTKRDKCPRVIRIQTSASAAAASIPRRTALANPFPGFQLTQEAHRRDGLSVHRGRRTPAPLRACKSAVTEATSGQESVESFVPARVRRAAENCRHFEAIESPSRVHLAAPYQPCLALPCCVQGTCARGCAG